MIILLSPAKNLDFARPYPQEKLTQPVFKTEANKLIKSIKNLSVAEVASLMHLSDNLAQLNADRYQSYSIKPKVENTSAAAFAFNGEVYSGLDIASFSESDLAHAQDHLRILSGLYGVLKPLDQMQAYRLEMGTKFSAESDQKNLYQYWGSKISNQINKENKSDVLINLASNEYFKSVDKKTLKSKIITLHFKEDNGGQPKIVMVYAKKARGMMAREILLNRVENPEDIKSLTFSNYQFIPEMSTESDWMFVR